MVIAGAGGHGQEVFQLLVNQGFEPEGLIFFDEDVTKKGRRIGGTEIITDWDTLNKEIEKDPRFCLGVGNPESRQNLTQKIENLGGRLFGLKGSFLDSFYNVPVEFDQMSFTFIGPSTKIGKGVLINTRANVHHGVEIGDFSEIGPGALLLGEVKIGKMCRIGAGAIVLPGVILGNRVIVGAGAVVTKNRITQGIIKGIPAK